MTRLYLIRHGETDWNVEGRWQGQANVPLNARGRAQAARLAQALKDVPFDAVYSSDLARARETAEALARLKGLPVHEDPRLREIHQGEWQGMLVTEIQARYAERFERRKSDPLRVAPPGGETVAKVRERVVRALEEILAKHPGGTVAVVSHGFALAVALAHFRHRPIEEVWGMIPENGEWQVLDVEPEMNGEKQR
ncbi:MAG: alpha-ribazole phosphatase [Anaerolineae bacterium]|nr:MAG: alpha-ribazole phosphatase [Anaerolineae bacterium]